MFFIDTYSHHFITYFFRFIIIAMLMVNKIHSIVLMAPFSMNIWELVIMPQQCFARVAKGMQDPLTLLTMPPIMPLTM